MRVSIRLERASGLLDHRPSKAYYFLLFTSHPPFLLRLPHPRRALFPNIYFNHARPERITHANAVSAIGRDQYAIIDFYTSAARICDPDGYIDLITNADVHSASTHSDSCSCCDDSAACESVPHQLHHVCDSGLRRTHT